MDTRKWASNALLFVGGVGFAGSLAALLRGCISGRADGTEVLSHLLLVCSCLLLAILGFRLQRNVQRSIQQERDAAAEQTMRALLKEPDAPGPTPQEAESAEGTPGDLVLYLRPFDTTGKLVVPNPYHNSWGITPERFTEQPGIELEALIARSLPEGARFLALGRPGEHFGAGRIRSTEEDWWASFTKLASRSAVVLLVPGAGDGVLQEIRWLREQARLDRTMILMPPLTTKFPDYHTVWAKAQEELAAMGFELSPYHDRGALLLVDGEKTIAFLVSLSDLETDALPTIFHVALSQGNLAHLLEAARTARAKDAARKGWWRK